MTNGSAESQEYNADRPVVAQWWEDVRGPTKEDPDGMRRCVRSAISDRVSKGAWTVAQGDAAMAFVDELYEREVQSSGR